jgi:hypothetical protein
MKKVKSSNIAEVGYDESTRILDVLFKGGGHYRYQDVPPEKYKALMKAPSIGKHLHAHIKGAHEFEKLST